MFALLTGIYIVICLVLILAVLLQQGKGASMGILSGAGQSWFGPSGGKTFLMKMTVVMAMAFLLSSILITILSSRRTLMAPPPQAAAEQPVAPPSQQ